MKPNRTIRSAKAKMLLFILFLLTLLLSACGTAQENNSSLTQAAGARIAAIQPSRAAPTAAPTPTQPPPKAIIQEVAQPEIVPFNQYGVIKAKSPIYDGPGSKNIVEVTGDTGIVQFQNRNADSKWYEKLGGGWVEANNAKTFDTLQTAQTYLSSLNPQPTSTPIPTATPTPKPLPTPTDAPAPPVAPAGGSGIRVGAICNDGTSSSATGQGACSHHKGVNHWLYK